MTCSKGLPLLAGMLHQARQSRLPRIFCRLYLPSHSIQGLTPTARICLQHGHASRQLLWTWQILAGVHTTHSPGLQR